MRHIIPYRKSRWSKPRAFLWYILDIIPRERSILRYISNGPCYSISDELTLLSIIIIFIVLFTIQNRNKLKIRGITMKKSRSNLVHDIPTRLFVHLLSGWEAISLRIFPHVLCYIFKLFVNSLPLIFKLLLLLSLNLVLAKWLIIDIP